jgi:hypothetical protein
MADSGGDSKGGGSSGMIGKVFATVFGAVVAPVLVAVGVKYLAPKDETKPPPPPPPVVAADKSADKDKDAVPKDTDEKKDAKEKKGDKSGKDLAPAKDPTLHLADTDLARRWYVYERVTEKVGEKTGDKDKKGSDKAPKDTGAIHYVYSRANAKDAAGFFRNQDKAILCTGKPGGLVSQEAYENYALAVEYKWQPVPPPGPGEKAKPRRSSLVLHAQDEGKVWMPGVQCLIRPGDTGSLLLRGEPDRVKVSARFVEKEDKETKKDLKLGLTTLRRSYKPDAPPKVVASGTKGWTGILYRLNHEPGLSEDEEPAAGKDDLEKSADWNTLECVCDGDSIVVKLNGKEVNVCKNVTPHVGRIVFLADGTPILFRRVDLTPLKK